MMLQQEQWLYSAVLLGVFVLALNMYMATRGIIAIGGKWHKRFQFLGLALLILPAAVEWYFSSSLIMLVAVFMCAYGAYQWFKQLGGK